MDLLQTLGPGVFEYTFFLAFFMLVYSFFTSGTLMTVVFFSVLYFAYIKIKKRTAKYVSPTDRYVLVTGCDTGIGHHLAITLDDIGFNVIATCLDISGEGATQLQRSGSKRMNVLWLDVSSDQSVQECLEIVQKECGTEGLWGLVNNAGINFVGDIELTTMKQYIRLNDVMNFGMVRTIKAFLPLLRKGKGRIVNVTSVKGRVAGRSNGAYSMPKWAGECLSDTLRQEMTRFGVKVVIVEPGHYGVATACLNTAGIERIKKDLDEQWEEASEEVKKTYGREYIDAMFKATISSGSSSATTLHPVMAAFKEALMNESPEYRYLVDGSNQIYDAYCFCARLTSFLPEGLMDRVLAYHLGTGPTPQSLQK